jgi:hypothetical protein
VLRPQYQYLVISTSFSETSAALRLQNNRKTTSVSSSAESAPKDLGTKFGGFIFWTDPPTQQA